MKEELGSNLVSNLEHWSIADELLLFLVIIMRQTCDDVGVWMDTLFFSGCSSDRRM